MWVAGAADYLAQDLSERVALTPRWRLTPYAADRSTVARDVREVTPCGARWGRTGEDVRQL